MPLFGTKTKTPTELVKIVHEALEVIEKCQEGKKAEKVCFVTLEEVQLANG